MRPKGRYCNFSLFVIVIFVYSELIPSRKARHSYRLLRIVKGQAKILVVVTFERHLAYLRTMKLA